MGKISGIVVWYLWVCEMWCGLIGFKGTAEPCWSYLLYWATILVMALIDLDNDPYTFWQSGNFPYFIIQIQLMEMFLLRSHPVMMPHTIGLFSCISISVLYMYIFILYAKFLNLVYIFTFPFRSWVYNIIRATPLISLYFFTLTNEVWKDTEVTDHWCVDIAFSDSSNDHLTLEVFFNLAPNHLDFQIFSSAPL